ncbi:hypothetical protein FHQ18_07225 [Deferribacter autotrophicus]|uniref:Uncharacterized protein n=2 Tax=Deferribacter autotrophicus TaxID=500465 RepID=A0A5A8F7N5_9BACT|nr:hypothetical protein FHQ18_07225 [Deferribacter autotrophicus]
MTILKSSIGLSNFTYYDIILLINKLMENKMAVKRIGELLVEKGIITEQQLEIALRRQKITGEKLGNVLMKMGFIDEDKFYSFLAEQYNLKKYEKSEIVITKEVQNYLSLRTVLEKEVIPLEIIDDKLAIGITNYNSLNYLDELEFESGKKIILFLLQDNVFRKIIEDLRNFPYGLKDYKYISLKSLIVEKFGNVDVEIDKVAAVIDKIEMYYEQIVFIDGMPPLLKKDNVVIKLNYNIITHGKILEFIKKYLNDRLKKDLITNGFVRVLVKINNKNFFVSVLKQKNKYSLTFIHLKKSIPDIMSFEIEDSILSDLLSGRSGLYIISAPYGHGKSTVLASIAYNFSINESYTLLFIDDFMIYDINSNNSLVYQFEVGNDFPTFYDAIKTDYFLNSNVIFVSKVTTYKELELLINLAEAGKKVFLSVEAPNVTNAIYSLINLMDEKRKRVLLNRFSNNLRLCIAQRLVKLRNSDKKLYVYEYIKMSLKLKKFIMEESFTSIDTQLKGSNEYIPLEKKFADLVSKGVIEKEDIFRYSVDYDFLKTYLKE